MKILEIVCLYYLACLIHGSVSTVLFSLLTDYYADLSRLKLRTATERDRVDTMDLYWTSLFHITAIIQIVNWQRRINRFNDLAKGEINATIIQEINEIEDFR